MNFNYLYLGYDGVDDFLSMLRDVIIEEINLKKMTKIPLNGTSEELDQKAEFQNNQCLDYSKQHSNSEMNSVCQSKNSSNDNDNCMDTSKPNDKTVIFHNGNDIDSGIDTSDSCDEKKNKKQTQAKIVKRHSRNLTSVLI